MKLGDLVVCKFLDRKLIGIIAEAKSNKMVKVEWANKKANPPQIWFERDLEVINESR